MLVDQISHEKIAQYKLNATFDYHLNMNILCSWVYMLVATCWSTQESNEMKDSEIVWIFQGDVICLLLNSKVRGQIVTSFLFFQCFDSSQQISVVMHDVMEAD